MQVVEQGREPVAQQLLRRTQCLLADGRQRDGLTSPVIDAAFAPDEAARLEPGQQLRDGRGRDGGAPCELGADDVALVDRLEREVLRDASAAACGRKQPLDPAADERHGAGERIRGVTAARAMAWAGH